MAPVPEIVSVPSSDRVKVTCAPHVPDDPASAAEVNHNMTREYMPYIMGVGVKLKR